MIYRKILLSILLLILSCAPLAFAEGAASCATLKGVKVDFNDPFKLEFIVDYGRQGKLDPVQAKVLVNYFLAALAMPEDKMWVNLSPYEPDRVIEPDLSQTEFGEGLLSQDCALKQFAASLTNPGTESGKRYWDALNSPPSTDHSRQWTVDRGQNAQSAFNKVWIVPHSAKIYQNEDTALIESRALSVMTEEDYLAATAAVHSPQSTDHSRGQSTVDRGQGAISAFKTIILPLIDQEVNSGERFVPLRQMYDAFILASWFKKRLQDSLFRYYLDQGKVSGIDLADKDAKEKIYNQYVQSFAKGEYNVVKKDYDHEQHKITARQYVSGGIALGDADRPFVATALSAGPMPKNVSDRPNLAVILTPVYDKPEFILDEHGMLALSHERVNMVIRDGLSEKIKKLSVEKIKARYRDKSGVIILPVKGLLRKTGLPAHIGLGNYYDEPVIYIDDMFTKLWRLSAYKKIKRHELYEIGKWEAKRKELGLSYKKMRQWIKDNSNRQGKGLAQQLARQWHDEANAINDSSIVQVADRKQSTRAYRAYARGRVDRCLDCILATMQRNAKEYKNILGVGGLYEYFTVALTSKPNAHIAAADEYGNLIIRYEFLDVLTDEELICVLGHEMGHIQNASWDNQNMSVAEQIARMNRYRSAEERYRAGENLADKSGMFLALKAGGRPDVVKNALKKGRILMDRLGKIANYTAEADDPPVYVHAHPDNLSRVEEMERWHAESGIEYPGTIYEEDVVLAAAPDSNTSQGAKDDLGGVDFGYNATHVIILRGKLSDKDFPAFALELNTSRGLRIKDLSIQSKP